MPPEWRVMDRPAEPRDWLHVYADDRVLGALVNITNVHWACVARHRGCVWYIDSMSAPPPVFLDEGDWCDVVRKHPMRFLVIRLDIDGLE